MEQYIKDAISCILKAATNASHDDGMQSLISRLYVQYDHALVHGEPTEDISWLLGQVVIFKLNN